MHLHLIEMTDALLMDDKCTRLHEFYYLTNVSQNNLYHDVFCLFRETGVEENDELVKGITISALKALGEKYVYDFMVLQNYIVCLYGKDYIQSGAVLVEYKDYNILCYSGGRVIDGDKVQFFSLPYSGTWRLLLENLKAIYLLKINITMH